MSEPEKCYITVWALQEEEIKHYCFDQCKKVIFGFLDVEDIGGVSHCYIDDCPYLEAQLDEPFGELNGRNVYLRKLRPIVEE